MFFFNGYGLFYCTPVGKGEPVAQRIRENTLCPSRNGSLPVFQRRGKGHLSATTQEGLHNGTQAVVQWAGPGRVPICQKMTKCPFQNGSGPVVRIRRDPSPSAFWNLSETGGPNMYLPVSETPHGHNMTHSVKNGLLPVSKWAFCPFILPDIIKYYEFTT
jgi:hypothetical protein